MRRRTWMTGAAMLLMLGCGGSAEVAEPTADGVVISVSRDRSGESAAARFHDAPVLLVVDDGRAFMAPPLEFAATGELVPDVWVQSITPAGIERLRAAGSVPASFVPDDLAALVGVDNLGPLEFLLPDDYLFAATPVEQADGHPVLVWPDTASVALADVDDCQRLPENEVGEAFETAAEGSLFEDDGVLYSVLVKQAWPGATC